MQSYQALRGGCGSYAHGLGESMQLEDCMA
jgi:hypothetical protein